MFKFLKTSKNVNACLIDYFGDFSSPYNELKQTA